MLCLMMEILKEIKKVGGQPELESTDESFKIIHDNIELVTKYLKTKD